MHVIIIWVERKTSNICAFQFSFSKHVTIFRRNLCFANFTVLLRLSVSSKCWIGQKHFIVHTSKSYYTPPSCWATAPKNGFVLLGLPFVSPSSTPVARSLSYNWSFSRSKRLKIKFTSDSGKSGAHSFGRGYGFLVINYAHSKVCYLGCHSENGTVQEHYITSFYSNWNFKINKSQKRNTRNEEKRRKKFQLNGNARNSVKVALKTHHIALCRIYCIKI